MNTRYLQSFSEQRLLALESRANEETDNAYVQASYLEAALEIDPKYVIKRVESGQYAVNDDVRYIYKKVCVCVCVCVCVRVCVCVCTVCVGL